MAGILNGKDKRLLPKAERMSVAEMVIKMQDLVPNPAVAFQKLKDSNLLDTVIELTGQCLNMGFEIAVDDQAIFNVCG
jgi:hypothetical protein